MSELPSVYVPWYRRWNPMCKLFGHKRSIEDMGGVIYEVCDRCNWVGRHHEYECEIRTAETGESK